MIRIAATRTIRLIAVLFIVSLGSFFLLSLIPGDPVASVLGRNASPADYDATRHRLGLDRPIGERYLHWIGGMFSGNFGETLVPPTQKVSSVVTEALPITLEIAVLALLIGVLVGIPLGVWAAYRAGGMVDRIIGLFTFGLISVPVFVMGFVVILLLVFRPHTVGLFVLLACVAGAATLAGRSFVGRDRPRLTAARVGAAAVLVLVGVAIWATIPVFPRQGWVPLTHSVGGNLKSAFLPALTLSLGLIPLYAQVLRSDMQQTLKQDFITVARAKGMPTSHILIREALRPSLFSLVTVAGLSFGQLLGGSVIVESLFNLPGLGKLVVGSIQSKDYLVVQAGVLIIASAFVLINALVDVSYSVLEPRVRRAHV